MLYQFVFPVLRYLRITIQFTGKLPCRCRDASGIIREIGGKKDRITEIIRIPYRPHCCFKRIDYITAGTNLMTGFMLVLTRVDYHDPCTQRKNMG